METKCIKCGRKMKTLYYTKVLCPNCERIIMQDKEQIIEGGAEMQIM